MSSVVVVVEKEDWLKNFVDSLISRSYVLQERPDTRATKNTPRVFECFEGVEALVVGKCCRYRERVLAPSLIAVGFAKVHTAKNAVNARKQLFRFPRIGIIVVNDTLTKPNDRTAIYKTAKASLIPVVLLTERDVLEADESSHIQKVVNKNTVTILETVRLIKKTAESSRARKVSRYRQINFV
jgi:hypothetical protein